MPRNTIITPTSNRLVTPFIGAFVKPCTVNWADMSYDNVLGKINTVQVKRVTCTNRRIVLRIRASGTTLTYVYWHVAPNPYWSDGVGQLVSDLNAAAASGIGSTVTQDIQTTPLLIGVNPDDYVTFAAYNASNSTAITLTVENVDDSDTTVDTFGIAYGIA